MGLSVLAAFRIDGLILSLRWWFKPSMENDMKYALAIASVFWAGQAFAQAAPIVAPNDMYTGTVIENGSTTVYVEQNGRYGDAIEENSPATAYFEANGKEGVEPMARIQRVSMPGGYPPAYGAGPGYGYGGPVYGPGPYGYGPRAAFGGYGYRGVPYGYGYRPHRHHGWGRGWGGWF